MLKGDGKQDDRQNKALNRPGSSTSVTEDLLKCVSYRFDVELVFRFNYSGKGLARITGLSNCVNLTDLNLSNNNITRVEGLEGCVSLRRLQLSSNQIAIVENLAGLTKLTSLLLLDNQICTLDALGLPLLSTLPALRCLCLRALDRSAPNPVCSSPGYRAAILKALPQLKNLDGERGPFTSQYMDISEEVERWRANPPPPKPLVLPDVTPWMSETDQELEGGVPEAEVCESSRFQALSQTIAMCRSLDTMLSQQVTKTKQLWQQQQQQQKEQAAN